MIQGSTESTSRGLLAIVLILGICFHLQAQSSNQSSAQNSEQTSNGSTKSSNVKSSNAKSSTERAIAVSAMKLRQTTSFESKRQFSGQIESQRKSSLGFDRIGRVETIEVEEGDEIVKGQPLARLDAASLLAQKKKLLADLKSAEAQLREAESGPRAETIAASRASLAEQVSQFALAKEMLDRRERLLAKKLITKEEWEQAKASFDRTKSAVDGATSRLDELLEGTRQERIDTQIAIVESLQAAVDQIEVEIDKSVLRSPYDGKVLTRDLDEGSIVAPGRSLLTIAEFKNLEARVGVPPAFARSVKKGRSIQVECDGEMLTGTVHAIIPEVDPTTRTQSILVRLGETAFEKVVAGDSVRVAISQEKREKGFWVPTESLTAGSRGLWNCFIVEGITEQGVGTAVVRTVEVLHTAGDRSMIIGPIEEGEVIVNSAPHRIIAGQIVQPLLD